MWLILIAVADLGRAVGPAEDHQGTLAEWERGEGQPSGEYLRRVDQFLDQGRRHFSERRAGAGSDSDPNPQ